jgi:hypothetical protein
MWHRIGIVTLLAIGLFGCSAIGGFNVTRGSGHVTTQTRDVSGFTGVSMTWQGDLSITQGDTEGLSIEAEDNILPLIITNVQGGKLIIGLKEGFTGGVVVPTKPVKYNLQVKNLNSIDVSGAGTVTAASLKSDNLKLSSSGAANMNLQQINATSLSTDTSGAGNLTLAGQVQTQDISISGFGNYNAGDLQSDSATLELSGTGSATVWAAKSLSVKISGAGNVSYYGSPQVTQTLSGVGSVKSLGNK